MFPLKKLLQWLRLSVVTLVVVLWSSGPSAQLGLVCMVLHLMFNFKGLLEILNSYKFNTADSY